MAKTDLKSAYQHVPVHPADQHLLGIEWNGTTYLDRALPFGLRSAPKLFTAVADGVPWALFHVGVHNGVHYLDDFLLWGPTDSPLCAENCERLGLPVAPEKTVGPCTVQGSHSLASSWIRWLRKSDSQQRSSLDCASLRLDLNTNVMLQSTNCRC